MYNIWVPVASLILIGILSVVWKLYFSAYIKKKNTEKAPKSQGISEAIADSCPVSAISTICIMCSALLTNSDERVAGTLKYIRPTLYLNHILEKQDE